jgi:hypothetical protein
MHLPASHRTGFGESGEKKPPVVVIMENRFSPVAARYHVVKGTGELKSKAAWHAGKLAGEREICQDLHPDPIHFGENGVVEAWLEWDGHGRVMRMPLTEAVMLADPASGGEKSTCIMDRG